MRKLITSTALALVLLTGLVWTQTSTNLVILHTNDLHSQILPRDGVGGLAEMATIMRRERGDFVLDGGDMFTGTMLNDEFAGKPIIEILNRLNYRAVALGNHELDYGLDEFRKRAREANFPILSANVLGIDEVKPYTIINVKGIRIGVIGLTVERLEEVTHPKNVKPLTVKNVVDALRETLPKVRPLSDFIVLVTHITFDEQLRVAKAFPEVRLIVTGHPHFPRATQVGTTLIVETGSSGRYLGKVELRLAGGKPESMTSELIPVRDVPPDPEIKAIIDPYNALVHERAAERLGVCEADLRRSETEESPLNNVLADAFRERLNTEIAIHNNGGIRAPLLKGTITYGTVFDVLPFDNTLVKMTLLGADIKRVLARRVVAVSGIRVSWDMTKPSGERLVWVTLSDGSPLLDNVRYTVTVNDFNAAGGDGLLEFMRGQQVDDTKIKLREAFAAYVRNHRLISAKTDGRVTIKLP